MIPELGYGATVAAFVLASAFWRIGLRSYTGASA